MCPGTREQVEPDRAHQKAVWPIDVRRLFLTYVSLVFVDVTDLEALRRYHGPQSALAGSLWMTKTAATPSDRFASDEEITLGPNERPSCRELSSTRRGPRCHLCRTFSTIVDPRRVIGEALYLLSLINNGASLIPHITVCWDTLGPLCMLSAVPRRKGIKS